jgi:hypothetical protein
MARIKQNPLIPNLSGVIGGQSIARTQRTNYVRNITQTNTSPTVKQSKQRVTTAFISQSYKALSAANKLLWENASSSYLKENRKGEVKDRNGFETFSFLNQNNLLLGLSIAVQPPTFQAVFTPTVLIDSGTVNKLIINSAVTGYQQQYLIFANPYLGIGETMNFGKGLIVGKITQLQLEANIDILPFIISTFGALNSTMTIGFYLSAIVNSNGNRDQFPNMYVTPVTDIGPVVFDSDYQAVLDYAVLMSYGLPSDDLQIVQNQLMLDLKSNGTYATFDVLYILASDSTEDFTTINWVSPNSHTLGQNMAYAGTLGTRPRLGPSGPASTNYNPTNDAVNYGANNASYGFYSGERGIAPQASGDSFVYLVDASYTILQAAGTVQRSRINSSKLLNWGFNSSIGNFNQADTYNVIRQNSGSASLVRDGSFVTSITNTGVTIPNNNFILGRSSGGYTNAYIIAHIGGDLTTAQCLSLDTLIRDYQVDVVV